MNVYLSAPRNQHARMRAIASALMERGHVVTSRWPWFNRWDKNGYGCQMAGWCLDELKEAECLVCFAGPDWGSGPDQKADGAYLVEFGYALATGLRLIMVGGSCNYFLELGQVEHVPDVRALLLVLGTHQWVSQEARS